MIGKECIHCATTVSSVTNQRGRVCCSDVV